MIKNMREAIIGGAGLALMATVHAGSPVWTFKEVLGYPSSISLSSSETAIIKYIVTNQSHKPHTLRMKPIRGIVSSGCTSSLGYQQSCTLVLSVSGNALQGDALGGPILCDQTNSNQCYQPNQINSLAIRLTQSPPIQQYTVISSAGSHGTISPIGSQTVNPGAALSFTATPDSGYGVAQWFVDSNLAQTGGATYQLTNITSNHNVNVTFSTVTLTPSVGTLALSINCQPASACASTQNIALTGNQRQITIQNTGSINATNLSVISSGLPSGTTINTDTCNGSTLNAGGSCIITLTPGSTTNSGCTSGIEPTAGTVTVSADGGLSTPINIYVLSYGCQYQGGFLYSVDDTTPLTGSIGGKVVSLQEQISSASPTNGIIWSSNGNSATNPDRDFTTILGIDETSTTSVPSPTSPPYSPPLSYAACEGKSNGFCNSGNILSYYNANRAIGGSAPTPLNYYAAGLCTQTINSYSDWYLPAICELDAVHNFVSCSSGTQSMFGSLSFLVGDPNTATPSTSCSPPSNSHCFAGNYWSSTENNGIPVFYAWYATFNSNGISRQNFSYKFREYIVRCSRSLTF